MLLKIILMLLLLFLLLLLIYNYSNSNINIKESYENYLNCLKKGYSKLFCLENKNYPNLCVCKNGTIGEILPGYKGKCICNNHENNENNNNENNNHENNNHENNNHENNNHANNNDSKTFLDNYFYKRSIYKPNENIIPYSNFGNYSFF